MHGLTKVKDTPLSGRHGCLLLLLLQQQQHPQCLTISWGVAHACCRTHQQQQQNTCVGTHVRTHMPSHTHTHTQQGTIFCYADALSHFITRPSVNHSNEGQFFVYYVLILLHKGVWKVLKLKLQRNIIVSSLCSPYEIAPFRVNALGPIFLTQMAVPLELTLWNHM